MANKCPISAPECSFPSCPFRWHKPFSVFGRTHLKRQTIPLRVYSILFVLTTQFSLYQQIIHPTIFTDHSYFFYSILSHNIGRSSGHYRWTATIPFHLVLFSAALAVLAKSISVHCLILSSHLFFCLPRFLFPSTGPCRIVFAKPEDLKTWPNNLSFHLLTRVRSSFYSPMAAWIFLRTFSLVTLSWSLQMGFSFVRAAVACSILERILGLEPSSETTAPRYLNLDTVPGFCSLTFISLWMPLALFVISLVFILALISIFYLCRFCRDFLLGLLASALPQLEHLCHRWTGDW